MCHVGKGRLVIIKAEKKLVVPETIKIKAPKRPDKQPERIPVKIPA